MVNCAEGIYFHGLVWDRSKPAGGPFCNDPDGNLILDLSSHGAAFPLGYNHPELIETAMRAAAVNPGRYGAEIIGAWGDDPEAIDIPTPSHLAQKLISLCIRKVAADWGEHGPEPTPFPQQWRTGFSKSSKGTTCSKMRPGWEAIFSRV
jgi:hypothetical protein